MCLTPQSAEFDASMQELIDSGLAIARGETDAHLYLMQARALWEVRDLQGTAAALDRAISSEPPLSTIDLSLAYSSRSICLLQMGEVEAAERDATASLELNPRSHPFGLRGLIRCYQNR